MKVPMVTQEELLAVLKDIIAGADATGNPAIAAELAGLRARVSGSFTMESPLAQVGWDSLEMTWVLVRLEERLGIDTSSLSLFSIFTVGDLLRELQLLANNKQPSNG